MLFGTEDDGNIEVWSSSQTFHIGIGLGCSLRNKGADF